MAINKMNKMVDLIWDSIVGYVWCEVRLRSDDQYVSMDVVIDAMKIKIKQCLLKGSAKIFEGER